MTKRLDPENVERMVSGSISEMLYVCQTYVGAAGDISPEDEIRLGELQKELTDMICRIVEPAVLT